MRVYVVPPVTEMIQLLALKPAPNGPFQMQLYGTLFYTYVIQTTTNWNHWLDLSTNVMTTNPMLIEDTNNASRHQFYRARQQP